MSRATDILDVQHTLLGHLALRRFTNQVEDLATEALGYLLSQSGAARNGVRRHIARFGVALPDELAYATQSVGDSEERPDLVGRTSEGEESLLIEAKFSAGSGFSWRGSYFQLYGAGVLLFFSLSQWLKHGMTPLWLTVFGDQGATERSDKKAALQALEPLRNTSPERVFEDERGFPTVAILLPVGVERDRVLSCIVEQVEGIGPLVADLPKKQRAVPALAPNAGRPATDSKQPDVVPGT